MWCEHWFISPRPHWCPHFADNTMWVPLWFPSVLWRPMHLRRQWDFSMKTDFHLLENLWEKKKERGAVAVKANQGSMKQRNSLTSFMVALRLCEHEIAVAVMCATSTLTPRLDSYSNPRLHEWVAQTMYVQVWPLPGSVAARWPKLRDRFIDYWTHAKSSGAMSLLRRIEAGTHVYQSVSRLLVSSL